MVLAAGRCSVGLESTVLDLSEGEPRLLRPGGVSIEDIEHITGRLTGPVEDSPLRSPGMTARHYAPQTRLRMDAAEPEAGEGYHAFGDLTEAAANLFDMLHRLDEAGLPGIAVAPIPTTGLGLAINDRLQRASKS